jgi:outer membrane lipoprotein-sorting protein
LFLSLAGTIFPQGSFSSDIDDNIEKIQKAYKKIRDMKGSFTQINTIRDLDKTATYKGQFFIKQPFRMIWMHTGKTEQDIYINNDTVLIYKREINRPIGKVRQSDLWSDTGSF